MGINIETATVGTSGRKLHVSAHLSIRGINEGWTSPLTVGPPENTDERKFTEIGRLLVWRLIGLTGGQNDQLGGRKGQDPRTRDGGKFASDPEAGIRTNWANSRFEVGSFRLESLDIWTPKHALASAGARMGGRGS